MKGNIAIIGNTGLVGEAIDSVSGQRFIKIPKDVIKYKREAELSEILINNNISTIINCAAYVRGIEENSKRPYDMYKKNEEINSFVLDNVVKLAIENYILFGSNCMYSRKCTQPYKEEMLRDFDPVHTNYGFAAAKFEAYYRAKSASLQYGFKLYFPIPCSLFGRNDNYILKQSHVVASVIRKLIEAKASSQKRVVFWGSGEAKREIMHADNVLSALDKMMQNGLYESPINIGSGQEVSIKELVGKVSSIVDYEGEIIWDESKPDGALRKVLDSSKIMKVGWKPYIGIEEGIKSTIKDYLDEKCIRV